MGTSLEFLKSRGISPFLATVYVVCRAANDVLAFRLRIRDDEVIEHELLHADYTVPAGTESFTIKRVPYSPQFITFHEEATRAEGGVFTVVGKSDGDHWVFMSCMPWINFTHVVQPVHRASASIPHVIWGRYFQQDGEWKMPLSVQVHHSLVDGLHVAHFFERMETLFATPESTFGD